MEDGKPKNTVVIVEAKSEKCINKSKGNFKFYS